MEHVHGRDDLFAGDAAAMAAAFAPGTEVLRGAVAERLRRGVDDTVRAVQQATEGHDGALLTTAEERAAGQRLATHVRRGVDVLARWLGTGSVPTVEDMGPLTEVGQWMAESPIPFSRVVRANRAAREALWGMVLDEARRHQAGPTVVNGLRVAVESGCAAALVLLADQFDEHSRAQAAELAAKDRELAHRALHDPLTGVANRVLLFDRLRQVAQRARRHPGEARPAVLFIDLDDFKAVNEQRGHDTGDAVLRLLARRITGAVRPEDTVARLGSDEFVVLCESIADRDPVLELATRVLAAVQAPIVDGDQTVHIGASIGVAVGDHAGWDPDRLLSEADHAMYRAKQQGPGNVHASWLDAATADGHRPPATAD